MFDFVRVNRNSLLGLSIGVYFARRFAGNMHQLEKNTQEKKLFDPIKAKAQIQVYRDIYNLNDDASGEAASADPGSQLRIMKTA